MKLKFFTRSFFSRIGSIYSQSPVTSNLTTRDISSSHYTVLTVNSSQSKRWKKYSLDSNILDLMKIRWFPQDDCWRLQRGVKIKTKLIKLFVLKICKVLRLNLSFWPPSKRLAKFSEWSKLHLFTGDLAKRAPLEN